MICDIVCNNTFWIKAMNCKKTTCKDYSESVVNESDVQQTKTISNKPLSILRQNCMKNYIKVVLCLILNNKVKSLACVACSQGPRKLNYFQTKNRISRAIMRLLTILLCYCLL